MAGRAKQDQATQEQQQASVQPEAAQHQQPQLLASADRVETANSLALSVRQHRDDVSATLSAAIEAQNRIAQEAAHVGAMLLNGNYLHHKIKENLEDMLVQQDIEPVKMEFASLSAQELLGSKGQNLITGH